MSRQWMEGRLAKVLEAQERTASWLARRTDKSPSYVTRVLLGQRRPSEDFKARAAAALGVPADLLFSDPDPTDAAEAVA